MEPMVIILSALAVFGGYTAYSKKKEEEQLRKIQEERRRKEKYAQEELVKFEKWLTPVLVIDSNIWMNESYESFFKCLYCACHRANYKVEIFGVQFDEITNIKKSTAYSDMKNMRARMAIKRIETLQEDGLLSISPITIDAARGAYADPVIIKILNQKSQEGHKCTFFSDDVELRVRVREHLSNHDNSNFEIVDMKKIIFGCNEIREYADIDSRIPYIKIARKLDPKSLESLKALDRETLRDAIENAKKRANAKK